MSGLKELAMGTAKAQKHHNKKPCKHAISVDGTVVSPSGVGYWLQWLCLDRPRRQARVSSMRRQAFVLSRPFRDFPRHCAQLVVVLRACFDTQQAAALRCTCHESIHMMDILAKRFQEGSFRVLHVRGGV